jgi:heme-degrading monooxygenase HmoA
MFTSIDEPLAAVRWPHGRRRVKRSGCRRTPVRGELAAAPGAPTTTKESTMFIAMNRFKVLRGSERDFEQVWLTRETHLGEVPGFIVFHLLKGPDREDHVLYSSHTMWRSRADFEAWTKSEAFRKAHARAGGNKPLYHGHPEFEGFEVLQEEKRSSRVDAAE